jgi:hypothetical protein
MRVSWKKGFNRLFVIPACGWAIYALWYAPVQKWHGSFDLAYDDWSQCLSAAAHAQDKVQLEHCNAKHERDLRRIPHTAWTGLGLVGWYLLMAEAAIPPLIIYWLLRAAGLISIWIWRGFSEPRP